MEMTLLRIFVGEMDHHDGRPTYKALVHLFRERGLKGATVLRGVYGYGRDALLHSASPLRLSQDLPMVVEVVDTMERIEPLLDEVRGMVPGGLITLEKVRVV
jgi:PII-like signaling protein